LIVLVQFDICLFHKLYPKLLRIIAGTVDASTVILFFLIGQKSVNDDLGPLAVLKKLEGNKAPIKVLLLDH
jgi:hypothetical protein